MILSYLLVVDFFILCTAGYFVLLFFWVYFKYYRPFEAMHNLSPLFRVRDSLIYEIAKNPQLKEDKIVKHYIMSCNIIIKHTKYFTLQQLIDRFIESDSDIQSPEKRKTHLELIKQSSPEVQKSIANFYLSFLYLILKNTEFPLLVRIICKYGSMVLAIKIFLFVMKYLAYIFPAKKQTYTVCTGIFQTSTELGQLQY